MKINALWPWIGATSCVCAVLLSSPEVDAGTVNFSQLFKGRNACFELVDARSGHSVIRYNPSRCTERLTPCSTFKVPLALMAYEHHLIDAKTNFHWDGTGYPLESWNADQTPASWLANSVVWVSQGLTPQLGRPTIAKELASFKFGNADVSGDITGFWLTTQGTSSLEVSADEQVEFWRKLLGESLPASAEAQTWVRSILPQYHGSRGAILAGKTGSGFVRLPNGKLDRQRQIGWFVGLLHDQLGDYVVACDTADRKPAGALGYAGMLDLQVTKKILQSLGCF